MDLINRYIYAVTRRLPDKKKGDIKRELRSIIDDMLEQYSGQQPRAEKVKLVLQELGNPEILANNYRATKQYLIGPQLFSTYLTVLKIVLSAVFIGVSIAAIVSNVMAKDPSLGQAIISYIGMVFDGMLQGFTWVTIGFALAERQGVKLTEADSSADWSLEDLPQIPQKKATIPRSEPITGIIFSTLFLIIFWSSLNFFGFGFFSEEASIKIVPIFNPVVIGTFKWLLIASLIIGIAKETLKLIAGRWTLKLALVVVGLSLVSMVLAAIFLTNPDIWNANFVSEVVGKADIDANLVGVIWNQVTKNIIFVVIIAFILEAATALYKGFKASGEQPR